MKKILSLVLALFMLTTSTVGLTSCKKDEGPAGEETGTYKKYTEEVKFTTVRNSVTAPNFPEGMSTTQNPYWEYIKKELNVTCEVLWESVSYNDRLSLDITSGQLPDVFVVKDYQMYQQLYLSDMIEDLTDVYEQYATEEMKAMYKSYPDIFTYVTEDDRLMALPSTANGYQQALLWVRKDWLDALNLQAPRTLDEIAAVAKAFVEQDPGGNGKGNTIGIAINREHAFTGYRNSYGLEPVAGALGAFPKQWMADDQGKVYYGSVTPEFKQTLALVRSWIDQGILSKDLLNQEWEAIWGSVTSGQAGMWFFPWSWGFYSEFKEKNPRAEVICYNAPLDKDGKATFFTGAPFEEMLVVRKGYEHPEVVFKIMQLYMDIDSGRHKEGYEACQPLRDSNTVWYAAAPLGSFAIRYDDCIPRDARKLKEYLETGKVPEDTTDVQLQQWQKAKAWQDTQEGADNWAYYTARLTASLATDEETCNPVNPIYFFQTKTMLEIWDYLVSMENDMIRLIMHGEQGIEYFDTFVTDWKEAGGEDVVAEIQAIYDEKYKK